MNLTKSWQARSAALVSRPPIPFGVQRIKPDSKRNLSCENERHEQREKNSGKSGFGGCDNASTSAPGKDLPCSHGRACTLERFVGVDAL